MPTQTYIEAHELWKAWEAVCLSGAGKAELQTLAEYDIDPLADDAEEWVLEAINDQCAHEWADNARKAAA
jgi:hypothetical protein